MPQLFLVILLQKLIWTTNRKIDDYVDYISVFNAFHIIEEERNYL